VDLIIWLLLTNPIALLVLIVLVAAMFALGAIGHRIEKGYWPGD
jgi:hypothetical protein